MKTTKKEYSFSFSPIYFMSAINQLEVCMCFKDRTADSREQEQTRSCPFPGEESTSSSFGKCITNKNTNNDAVTENEPYLSGNEHFIKILIKIKDGSFMFF